MKYIVITADMIKSRKKIFSRHTFQNQLFHLNKQFSKDIFVNFSLLRGDEIQGILKFNASIFQIIRHLKSIFYDFPLKIGIGIGEIYNEEDIKLVNNSWELNGPAFFNARDSIDLIEKNKGKKDFSYFVYFKTGNDIFDKRFSLIYSYVDDSLNKWKKEIYEITFLEEKGLIHQKIAETFLRKENKRITTDEVNKMRTNITKKIQRSNWYKIKQTEQMLLELLREEITK